MDKGAAKPQVGQVIGNSKSTEDSGLAVPDHSPATKTTTSPNAPSVFASSGAIGKQFDRGGTVASVGEAVGGPLSSDGMIGKNFTSDGAIGGTADKIVGNK